MHGGHLDREEYSAKAHPMQTGWALSYRQSRCPFVVSPQIQGDTTDSIGENPKRHLEELPGRPEQVDALPRRGSCQR